jgi:hypothetical protein
MILSRIFKQSALAVLSATLCFTTVASAELAPQFVRSSQGEIQSILHAGVNLTDATGVVVVGVDADVTRSTDESLALFALESFKKELGIDPSFLKFHENAKSGNARIVRFQLQKNGILVDRKFVSVTLKNQVATTIHTDYVPLHHVSTVAKVSVDAAVQIAKQHAGQNARQDAKAQSWQKVNQAIIVWNGEPRLMFQVQILEVKEAGWRTHLVDAITGEFLASIPAMVRF